MIVGSRITFWIELNSKNTTFLSHFELLLFLYVLEEVYSFEIVFFSVDIKLVFYTSLETHLLSNLTRNCGKRKKKNAYHKLVIIYT